MAIATKRFSFLDNETNVGVKAFSEMGRDIENIADNALKMLPDDLTNVLKNASETIIDIKEDFDNAFKGIERAARDTIGSTIDFSKLPDTVVGGLADAISGGRSDIAKGIKDLLKKCARNGGGMGLGGLRPYNPSINCNNGKVSVGYGGSASNCNASSYGDLLGKLNGSSTLKTITDAAKGIIGLLSLAKHGYSLGMCGVLGSLMGSDVFSKLGLGDTEFSKTAGVLMSTLGSDGNTGGWVDAAASAITHDLTPLHYAPSAIGDFINNYELPASVSERSLVSFVDSAIETVNTLDPNWYLDDAGISIGDYADISMSGKSSLETRICSRAYASDSLDDLITSDFDHAMAAMIAV